MENQNPNLDNNSEMPEKFPSIMNDFLRDLSTTFPEFSHLWACWVVSDANMNELYKHCLTVYPERFFDILYQNDEIFLSTSTINTFFLPNVDFKMLFSIPDISENTKKTMWKYLQLIMITIMGSIKSSASFGDAASVFEGINEEELQSKLSETINGLSNFFKTMPNTHSEDAEEFAKQFAEGFESSTPEMEKAFESMFGSSHRDGAAGANADTEKENTFNFDSSNIPNVDELHGHIKGLFDGKIGSLAKELAEELSGEVMDMFDDGAGEVKSTGDILKKMMKNPKQIMELVKKISTKLDSKMKNGNISQEELMKEAGDLLSKMKGMGNGTDFQEMMKGMMKNMSPMMGAMMGKGAKMDMNKVNKEVAKNTHKERMLNKLQQRRAQMEQQEQEQKQKQKQKQEQEQEQSNYILEQTNNPNQFVFKGAEPQEKSAAKPPINDDWLNEPTQSPSVPKKGGKKGGKNKKK